MTGILYLVATPIGNLEDITLRAIRVLRECDQIACEDTRHSRKLLSHLDIHRPLVSFRAHSSQERLQSLLTALEAGQNVALITDAGTPALSDPGAELVDACVRVQVPIVAVPGPSALTAALALAGTGTARFVFEGFLPTTGRERRDRLQKLAREERAVVFFEAPHRLLRTLADLAEHCGSDRPLVLCRELTKIHEQVWRGTLEQARRAFEAQPPRGEFTLILAAAPHEAAALPGEDELRAALSSLIATGLSRSEASRQLAQKLGLPRKQLYALSLDLDTTAGGSAPGSASMNKFDAG